jgi:DNA helicase-2/ATP-dependent DNA helicase PcrA
MKPTSEQQAVIDSVARFILCVAGAGSGKTKTLVWRILRLIQNGVEPGDICVIVYTNEAARVIHDRLHPASGEFAINLGFVGTLHSFCLKHLQSYAGFTNVTVLDEEEADEELLRRAKAAGVKASEKELKLCRENWLREQFLPKGPVQIAVASYYRKMEATRALDFNSILTKALEHLVRVGCEKCGDTKRIAIEVTPVTIPGQKGYITCPYCVGQERQREWKHLFVDEAHDSSRTDMEIYAAIQTENRFIVCDSDQAIFGWRGGDITGVLELAQSPEWELLKLEGNFRCSPEICAAAQRLIEHNADRIPKTMVSLVGTEAATETAKDGAQKPPANLTDGRAPVSTVSAQAFDSDTAEAVGIAAAIMSKLALDQLGTEEPRVIEAWGVKPSDFAVLARTNAIAENIADTLEAHRIPVRRRVKPNLPEDWKKAKAALRMLQARNDDSIIRFIRLVNPSAAVFAEKQHALGKINLREQFMTGLECTVAGLGRDLKRLDISFASEERIGMIADMIPEATLADVVLAVSQDFEYETVGEGVFCSTVHQAKGKEFDTVIIAGCEEGTLPSRRSDLSEERRIFYVGMTRARRTLCITWAAARREPWGRMEYKECAPSRFIKEALP